MLDTVYYTIIYNYIYTCIYTDALQLDANETVEGYRNVDFPFFERLDQQLQSLSMILQSKRYLGSGSPPF